MTNTYLNPVYLKVNKHIKENKNKKNKNYSLGSELKSPHCFSLTFGGFAVPEYRPTFLEHFILNHLKSVHRKKYIICCHGSLLSADKQNVSITNRTDLESLEVKKPVFSMLGHTTVVRHF
jgi:hypothetical protein